MTQIEKDTILDFASSDISSDEFYKKLPNYQNDNFILQKYLEAVKLKNKEYLSAEPKIIFKNIVPEDFDRSIKRKSKNGNTFFEVDLSFNLHSMNPMDIITYSVLLNKKGFAIRLVTNVDSMILGNE